MNDALVIFIIAGIVIVAVAAVWLVAVLRDGRRLRGMLFHRPDIDPSRGCFGVKGEEHVTPAGGRWYDVSFRLYAVSREAAQQFVNEHVMGGLGAPPWHVDGLYTTAHSIEAAKPADDDTTQLYPLSDLPGREP